MEMLVCYFLTLKSGANVHGDACITVGPGVFGNDEVQMLRKSLIEKNTPLYGEIASLIFTSLNRLGM
jgi:hypothetical protein